VASARRQAEFDLTADGGGQATFQGAKELSGACFDAGLGGEGAADSRGEYASKQDILQLGHDEALSKLTVDY